MHALGIAMLLMLGLVGVSPAQAGLPAPRPELPRSEEVLNEPEFLWSAVRGAPGYRLEVATDHKFTNIAFKINTVANRYLPTTTWPAGSYWWRVKVTGPNDSRYSPVRSFTRRWVGPDGNGSAGQEVARPDGVTVEDFSSDAGLQAPKNALKVSWEPVPGAAYYEVQFDGSTDATCTTPHTLLTPYISGELAGAKGQGCDPKLELGQHWVRVRAVDETVEGQKYYSLWSDQARATSGAIPSPVVFTLGPNLIGSAETQPAEPTSPANGTVFMDVPTLEWKPVSWAEQYEVVIAYDQDFTNIVGRFRTANTRLAPLQRLPENTAIRSFYWFALPCAKTDESGSVKCLNENTAVNRPGKYRSFKKQSVLVEPTGVVRRGTPWVELHWQAYSTTMATFARKAGDPRTSQGGMSWYEVQLRPVGARWSQGTTITTDLAGYLPTDLRFGGRFEWRVRAVDESGMGRPWSETESVRTPSATAGRPKNLRATRSGKKVTLRWGPSKSRFFPVDSYTVYWSTNAKRWQPLTQVRSTRAAFSVAKKSRYWFMVSANNYAGEGTPARILVRGK